MEQQTTAKSSDVMLVRRAARHAVSIEILFIAGELPAESSQDVQHHGNAENAGIPVRPRLMKIRRHGDPFALMTLGHYLTSVKDIV